MPTKTILNNKAQYYPRPAYGGIHPIMLIGVGIFILPFLFPIFGINAPDILTSIFTTTAIILILIGAAMSIFKMSN